ncbi:MAG: cation:proton antiporter [Tepidisphaeraceae bacterium]
MRSLPGPALPRITTSQQRLRIYSIWDALVFALNGVVFILIGLTLPEVVHRLGHDSLWKLSGYALLIGLTAIVIRFAWIFLAARLLRIARVLRRREPMPPTSWLTLLSWAGMRGIVSLAAALAIPMNVEGNWPFPFRDEIVFVTFGVILLTLVGQGLTLGPLVRAMKLHADDRNQREEALARRELAFAALARLDTMELIDGTDPKLVEEVREEYTHRVKAFDRTIHGNGESEPVDACCNVIEIQREALEAEQMLLIKLRDDSLISDEVLRHIQAELDIESLRLQDPHGHKSANGHG